MNQALHWSPEQVEELKKMAGTMSCSQIGRILGRSKDAVKNKISSLNLPRYKPVANTEVDAIPKKKKISPIPVETELPPLIAIYKNNAPKRSYAMSEIVSKIEWCKTCHSPVSNVQEHRERLGCKRVV